MVGISGGKLKGAPDRLMSNLHGSPTLLFDALVDAADPHWKVGTSFVKLDLYFAGAAPELEIPPKNQIFQSDRALLHILLGKYLV